MPTPAHAPRPEELIVDPATRHLADTPATIRLAERIHADVAAKKPLRLHIGCGARVLRGWINIDVRYTPWTPELIDEQFYRPQERGGVEDFYALDVTAQLWPMPDGCVEAIFHEDFIEHIGQRQQLAFLAEAWRVLRSGGVHRVNTPCLEASMRRHSDFSRGMAGLDTTEWEMWHHVDVLTRQTLEQYARMVGYSTVLFNHRDGSRAAAILPKESRPGADRDTDGNIFCDLIKLGRKRAHGA